jgi:hypothetical protein
MITKDPQFTVYGQWEEPAEIGDLMQEPAEVGDLMQEPAEVGDLGDLMQGQVVQACRLRLEWAQQARSDVVRCASTTACLFGTT